MWKSLGKLFGGGGGGGEARAPGGEARADMAFGLDLLRALGPPGANLAFSPESVRLALGMALLGAAGETRAELVAALHLGAAAPGELEAATRARLLAWGDATRPYALHAANGFFVARALSLRAEAKDQLRQSYLAEVQALDFAKSPEACREVVNGWVAAATRGLIANLIGPGSLSPGTRLVIANALYFKGDWASKFLVDRTVPAPFTLPSGAKVPVATMHQTADHRVWFGPEAQLLELPYRGGDLAMTLVLPAAGSALSELEAPLAQDALRGWLGRLGRATVSVSLPRFSIDIGSISLKQPLSRLGLSRAFTAAEASFSGFTSEPLALDDIVHRARLTVTEEGTEAAAATALFASQSLDRRKPRAFALDRPFLFLLRDLRDGTVLFMGRVTDPRASAHGARGG